MKTFIISAGIVLATATGAFADSTALDVYDPAPVNTQAIDYTATSAIGSGNAFELGPRLGDGVTVNASQTGPIEFITEVGGASQMEIGPRFGDGDPY